MPTKSLGTYVTITAAPDGSGATCADGSGSSLVAARSQVRMLCGAAGIALVAWLTLPGPVLSENSKSPLQCTARAPGVSYEAEWQFRDKNVPTAVLKIFIDDEYNITIPATPSGISEIKTNISPAALEATTSEPMMTEETTTDDDTSKVTVAPTDDNDYDIPVDDWEYTEVKENSKNVVDFLEKEKIHLSNHAKAKIKTLVEDIMLKESWQQYCKEAEMEESDPVVVADGSFHPRYEQVAGVGVFRLHARARSWANARRLCELEGAQLAVPNSAQEAQALAQMHNRCPRLLNSHFNDYIWIGLHDQYSEGHWETVVGYPLNETGYVQWLPNQPDNAHHDGENCLSMSRSGYFNDAPCDTELPFICEQP